MCIPIRKRNNIVSQLVYYCENVREREGNIESERREMKKCVNVCK